MDITVTLSPAGNTTRRELAALASESAQALRGLRDVAGVAPVRGVAPDGAKGMAEELGAFVLSLQPAAITGGVRRAAGRAGARAGHADQGQDHRGRRDRAGVRPAPHHDRADGRAGDPAARRTAPGLAPPWPAHALLVGVSQFKDNRLAALNAPPNDVQALAGVLRDPERGGFGSVTVSINPDFLTLRDQMAALFNPPRSG